MENVSVGMQVNHKHYGMGIVKEVRSNGISGRCMVTFTSIGDGLVNNKDLEGVLFS